MPRPLMARSSGTSPFFLIAWATPMGPINDLDDAAFRPKSIVGEPFFVWDDVPGTMTTAPTRL